MAQVPRHAWRLPSPCALCPDCSLPFPVSGARKREWARTREEFSLAVYLSDHPIEPFVALMEDTGIIGITKTRATGDEREGLAQDLRRTKKHRYGLSLLNRNPHSSSSNPGGAQLHGSRSGRQARRNPKVHAIRIYET